MTLNTIPRRFWSYPSGLTSMLRPSLCKMPKLMKLQVLGQIYAKLYSLPTDHVDLSFFVGRREPTRKNACGTIACVAGWCAVDPKLKELFRLDTRGAGYAPNIVDLDSSRELDGQVFSEALINEFLFSSNQERYVESATDEDKLLDSRTLGLMRVLYLGHLIDTDKLGTVFKDPNSYLDDIDHIREKMLNSKFVRRHLRLPPQ